mgnify:CR=1 FL=1
MELAIMCGLPLSGKSTFAKKLQADGWVRVCPDDIRLALHGRQFVRRAEGFVWAVAEAMVRSLLIGGHKVVIDATNVSAKRRKRWVDLAEEFGLRLKIYWVTTDYRTCIKRNLAIKRLEQKTIDRMHAQFEKPSEEEGEVFMITCEEK